MDLITRVWGITTELVEFIPQSLLLMSIVLGWILIYGNWSISAELLSRAHWLIVTVNRRTDRWIYNNCKKEASTKSNKNLCLQPRLFELRPSGGYGWVFSPVKIVSKTLYIFEMQYNLFALQKCVWNIFWSNP